MRDVEPLRFRRQPCLQQIFLQQAADGGVQDAIDLFGQRPSALESTLASMKGQRLDAAFDILDEKLAPPAEANPTRSLKARCDEHRIGRLRLANSEQEGEHVVRNPRI